MISFKADLALSQMRKQRKKVMRSLKHTVEMIAKRIAADILISRKAMHGSIYHVQPLQGMAMGPILGEC